MNNDTVNSLLANAWKLRDQAIIFGNTKVGCALLTKGGETFIGCNIESPHRSHDIHAEVNTLGSMVASGSREPIIIAIVAERQMFTPCGACMDWIIQLASS